MTEVVGTRKASTVPVAAPVEGAKLLGTLPGGGTRNFQVGGANGLATNGPDGTPLATRVNLLELSRAEGELHFNSKAAGIAHFTDPQPGDAFIVNDDPDPEKIGRWFVNAAGTWVRGIDRISDVQRAVVAAGRSLSEMDDDVFVATASRNLLDPAKVVDGRQVASTGAIAGGGGGRKFSGFIPVTPGEKYTISAGGLKVGSTAFYTTDNIQGTGYIAGSVNTSSVTPSQPLTLTAPAGAVYLATSLASTDVAEPEWVQVEQGELATDYISFGTTKREIKPDAVPGLQPAVDALPVVAQLRQAMSVQVAAIGRNTGEVVTQGAQGLGVDMVFEGPTTDAGLVASVRYYSTLATAKVMQVYSLISGTFVRTASYTLPVPVIGDNVHDASDLGEIFIPAGSYIGFRGGTASGLTFEQSTAADGKGWYIAPSADAASFAKGALRASSRMQAGVEIRRIADLDEITRQANKRGPLSLSVTGDSFEIADIVSDKPLVYGLKKTASFNGSLKLESTTWEGVPVASVNDDICPIRGADLGTVGANHGFVVGVLLAPNPDGKTFADLGSLWQDSTGRQFVLVAITSHASTPLQFAGSYTKDSAGNVKVAAASTSGSLTHVSGATHTAAVSGLVAASASSGLTQLCPAIARRTLSISMDGAIVSGDAVVTGREIVVDESYEILDYASLYDVAKANVGASYALLADALIPGAVLVMNRFTWRLGGRLNVRTTYDELRPFRLGTCGAIQAMPIYKTAHTMTRYVPGMGVAGGHDWSAGVDMSSWASSVNLPASALVTQGQVSAFHLDVLTSSGSPVLGFAMGYLPFGQRADSASRGTTRVAKAPAALWNMRETKKAYPAFTSGETPGWGHIQVEGYRVFLNPTQISTVLSRRGSALGAWTALDSAAVLS